ncbi:DNA-processing protein DprA [Vallitalea sp.]|jgi:DNA processing protein|uniref:DNA-processing protein DprA n=1 Tax=Vallitalea sp. TaxID=1882829 RepID=UPI0025E497D4|nr:DNA-processing protein DprA [Vallitalea sp.]MCT4688215.1 DNA-processing protein DprA [Vallitalea sp.]
MGSVMEKEHYWLWLNNIKGIGLKKIKYLLNYFDEPKYIWEATDELNEVKGLREIDRKAIIQSRNKEKIIEYYNRIKKSNINFYSIDDDLYPEKLKNIYDYPYGIYVKGDIKDDSPILAIVGARRCTEYGREVAKLFGRELAKMGIIIISGMARGIDTAAHKGALEGGGKTYAVLGSGVNICYPKENYKLMDDICHKGALISEFPVNQIPKPGNFPLRNRIISGISDGVLVIEAAGKSGSLITADQALDQGKDVYSIPGRITDKLSEGTNNLIKMGAKLVTNIDDILDEISVIFTKEKQKNSENITLGLAEIEKIVYSCLSLEPLFIDDIHIKSNIPIDELGLILTKLELKGVIKQLPNKYFIKKL